MIETLPAGLQPRRSTPVFDAATMPAGLRHRHSTKPGVWGLIRVIEGRLRYRLIETADETILDPDHPGVVPPEQLHEVEPLGAVRFFVEFYDEGSGGDAPHG